MSLPFPLSEPPEAAALERGRKLFAGETDFLKGVVAMDGLPSADRPEVCFAGRSNVVKSSLINALTGRKALARASNTPGRTQEINYFTCGPLYLVDLPGYGFAKAPPAVVAKWQALMKSYLSGRATLRRAFVLIDARHGIKPVDAEILNLLADLRAEQNLTYLMVSHDLAVVGHMCENVAVMQNGEIVEIMTVADMRAMTPSHAYTKRLLDASLGYTAE